jgi:ABC-type multidrug transport system fused ATPase/permease subunit
MDSRILLLDEATSALDNVTQSRIQEAVGSIR